MARSTSKLGSLHTSGIYSDLTVDGPDIGTLVVIVDRAKNLPNRKSIGKQDPYCAARLGKEAKKTGTDRRGGQTPRWDQELRFTVRDSPDYQSLKVSVFNDDKKTELIGETWVNLDKVVVPGGGQSDTWHELKCRGKYCGEVRMELTYYDTRPKPPPERRADEGQHSAPNSLRHNTPVKRRPLPTQPGATPSPTGAREFRAAGAREYSSPAHGQQSAGQLPLSHRGPYGHSYSKSAVDLSRPREYQDQLHDSPSNITSHYDHRRDSTPYDPDSSHNPYPHTSAPDPYSHVEHGVNSRHEAAYEPHPPDPASFLPELPPMTSRGPLRNRSSQNPIANTSVLPSHRPPPELPHSHSAPVMAVDRYDPDDPHRRVIQHTNSDMVLATGRGPHHGRYHSRSSSRQELYGPPSTDHFDNGYGDRCGSEPPKRGYSHNDERDLYYGGPSQYSSPSHPAAGPNSGAPPPPPVHRTGISAPNSITNSPYYQGGADPHHFASQRDLASLYKDDFQHGCESSPLQSYDHRRSSQGEQFPPLDEYSSGHPGSSGGFPELPPLDRQYSGSSRDLVPANRRGSGQPYSRGYRGLEEEEQRALVTQSPTKMDSPQAWNDEPRSHRQSTHGSTAVSRYDHGHSQTYPPAQNHSPNYSRRHSQHSSAGANNVPPANYDTPSRPHPLSQQQVLSSSSSYFLASNDANPHDPPPIIRPLAISPKKKSATATSNASTPASEDRMSRPNYRTVTTRKSISPRPPSQEIGTPGSVTSAGNRFNMPYSPDSYNALNPNLPSSPPAMLTATSNGSPTYGDPSAKPPSYMNDAPRKGPIIDFHGNVVDPSDRLPTTAWAPEPNKAPAKDPSDLLPQAAWAPEPEPKGPMPKSAQGGRLRERLNGARDLKGSVNSSPGGGVGARASEYFDSPVGAGDGPASSPGENGSTRLGRNRLQKKAGRPQSIAALPNWSQTPIRDVPQPLDISPGSAGYGSSPSVGGASGSGYAVSSAGMYDGPATAPRYYSTGDQPQVPPPRPAKIPLNASAPAMSQDLVLAGGTSSAPTSQEMMRLSEEMRSIDLGVVGSGRVAREKGFGGRRLLGYNR